MKTENKKHGESKFCSIADNVLEMVAFSGQMHIRDAKTHNTLFTIGALSDGAIPNDETRTQAKRIVNGANLLPELVDELQKMYNTVLKIVKVQEIGGEWKNDKVDALLIKAKH